MEARETAPFSRRRYLFVAGSTLTALAVGIPEPRRPRAPTTASTTNATATTSNSSSTAPSFETDGDEVELDDETVSFERTGDGGIELTC